MSHNRSAFFETPINLLSIFFIILGVYIALPSAKILYNIQASRSWPQVAGQVISSDVERRWVSGGDGFGQSYRPRIWFSYDVNGHRYVSDTVSFVKGWTGFRRSAEKAAAQYSQGKRAVVYYDASDPQVAVLDVGMVPAMECVRLGVGVLLMLVGIVALVTTIFKGIFE